MPCHSLQDLLPVSGRSRHIHFLAHLVLIYIANFVLSYWYLPRFTILLYHIFYSFAIVLLRKIRSVGPVLCNWSKSAFCSPSIIVKYRLRFTPTMWNEICPCSRRKHFTFVKQIFHSGAISLARRANFVEKREQVNDLLSFFGGATRNRTGE